MITIAILLLLMLSNICISVTQERIRTERIMDKWNNTEKERSL